MSFESTKEEESGGTGMIKNLFEAEIDRIYEGRCPFCGADTKQAVFRDDISRRENEISGLCQVCQDRVFGASEVADTEEEGHVGSRV